MEDLIESIENFEDYYFLKKENILVLIGEQEVGNSSIEWDREKDGSSGFCFLINNQYKNGNETILTIDFSFVDSIGDIEEVTEPVQNFKDFLNSSSRELSQVEQMFFKSKARINNENIENIFNSLWS